jgi:hypothetical protein
MGVSMALESDRGWEWDLLQGGVGFRFGMYLKLPMASAFSTTMTTVARQLVADGHFARSG